MFVIGCGGSGTNPQSSAGFTLTRTPIQAQIQLPAGTPISNLTTLIPWSSGGATAPNSSGQTEITIFNNGPQYSDVRNAAGKLVLASYLSADKRTLNAETTAQAMIFFAIGGSVQRGDDAVTVLNGVPNLAGYPAVVDEVEDQLLAQGYVSLQTGTLQNDIQAIINEIGSPAPAGRGTIAEPTSQSGLTLNTLVDGKLTIKNDLLRRTRAWIRRVSYVDASGVEKESVSQYEKHDLSTAVPYGGIGNTLKGIVTGETLWTGTTSGPFDIPLYPADARSTKYELKTFGMGLSEGNYVNRTPEEINEGIEIAIKTLILDAILPAIANIAIPLGGGGLDEFVKFASGNAIIADLINLTRDALPQIINLLSEGKLLEAVELLWTTGFTLNSALPAILQLMIDFGEKYGPDWFFNQSGNFAEQIGEKLVILGYVDVFLNAANLVKLGIDIGNADQASIFRIETTSGKATLVADDPIASVFDTTIIKAVIQNKDPNSTYKYEWSVSAGYRLTTSQTSTNQAPNGVIETFDDFARISTETNEPGTAVVSCKVFRMEGDKKRPVDNPTLQYRFVNAPTFSPNPVSVAINDDVTIAMAYEGEETPLYKFSLDSTNYGTIDRTNIGSNPNVTFTSVEAAGTVNLKVECYLSINGGQQKFHTKIIPITIEGGDEIINFTYGRDFIRNDTTPPTYGCVMVAYFKFKRPNATHYMILDGNGVKRYEWNANVHWPQINVSRWRQVFETSSLPESEYCPGFAVSINPPGITGGLYYGWASPSAAEARYQELLAQTIADQAAKPWKLRVTYAE
ncbi:hypothetical protein CCB80_01940 [Armatimonadetes bacterium Uphvl-Ar1]|nr:hypothetical protein CCB80_01940 [Armatimonadetes bacterium Uphvl-Ar1]